MFGQRPPVVRQIEVQQTRALVRGAVRRVLTLFGLPQTRLRYSFMLRQRHMVFVCDRIRL